MQEKIRAYYRAERISNAIFAFYGMSCICFSAGYYIYKSSSLSFGFFIGLASIAAFQFLVGMVRFWKSFRLFKASINAIESNQSYLKNHEIKRLKELDQRFQQMRGIETLVFVVCIILIAIFAANQVNHILLGTVAAVLLHAAVLLVFDLFAQFRTREYTYQLEKHL